MSGGSGKRALEIVAGALELKPAERERFVARACGKDRELRGHVERLLAREERARGFLSSSGPTLSTVTAPAGLSRDPILEAAPELDGYRLLGPCLLYEKIGQGGMGAVYRGYHVRLEIDVAVKCLLPTLRSLGDDMLARFRREARIAARVTHQNLVRLYDCGEQHGIYYLIMEHVSGPDLRQWVARSGPAPPGEAIAILLEAANGLQAAHAEDVVHRDIKPDNLLLSRKGVKVSDLGLGRMGRSDPALTMSNAPMGSPRYMPPEQWESIRRVGPEGDVWALGVTLHFLLSGEDAFPEGSLHELGRRICEGTFPDIRVNVPDLPPPLLEVLATCTRRRPEERYRDAGALAAALRELQEKHGLRGGSPERRWAAGASPVALETKTPLRRPPHSVLARITVDPQGTTAFVAASPRRRRLPGGFLSAAGAVLCLLAALAIHRAITRDPVPAEIAPQAGRRDIRGFRFETTNPQGRDEYRHERSGLLMVLIDGGSFLMGSPESDAGAGADEKPPWTVTVSPFLIAKHEVSQEEWERVMEGNPSPPADRSPRHPVTNVSWHDCQEYCEETDLSLPTEAEWEYACRAGTTTAFAFGERLEAKEANFGGAHGGPLPVDDDRFPANGFGLINMHGNVFEWCADSYDASFYSRAEETGEDIDPQCRSGEDRALRGGNFASPGSECRSASRRPEDPAYADQTIGFRPVLRLAEDFREHER